MADPAELIRRYKDALLAVAALEFNRAEYTSDFPPARDKLNAAADALLAALTPQHSPEDAAVLDHLISRTVTCVQKMSGPRHDFDMALVARDAARAAVLARMAGKVPTGWKLVPVEPTKKMIEAAKHAGFNPEGGYEIVPSWSSMLAAAPESPR